jgi:hypothetical protein
MYGSFVIVRLEAKDSFYMIFTLAVLYFCKKLLQEMFHIFQKVSLA